jgi:prevent-host-death family protein
MGISGELVASSQQDLAEAVGNRVASNLMLAQPEEVAMLDLRTDIRSLSNFKRETATLIRQLKETGRPVVLTVNGKAELVVQDAASYQRLLEIVERLETNGIRVGMEEMKAGKGRPAAEVLGEDEEPDGS